MALGLCCSRWAFLCWLAASMAQGAEGWALPPAGTQLATPPTDCQIFTLTPPPATRIPVTQPRPTTRQPLLIFPQWPRVPPRFPGRPFLTPHCSRSFLWQVWFWPRCCLTRRRCFLRRELHRGSSSEETREGKGLHLRSRRGPDL